jgi:hypothetical protein
VLLKSKDAPEILRPTTSLEDNLSFEIPGCIYVFWALRLKSILVV